MSWPLGSPSWSSRSRSTLEVCSLALPYMAGNRLGCMQLTVPGAAPLLLSTMWASLPPPGSQLGDFSSQPALPVFSYSTLPRTALLSFGAQLSWEGEGCGLNVSGLGYPPPTLVYNTGRKFSLRFNLGPFLPSYPQFAAITSKAASPCNNSCCGTHDIGTGVGTFQKP